MKYRVTSQAMAVAAAVLLLAGCGGGTPRLGEAEVDEASATSALSAMEATWRADNSNDTELRIHKDARCYLVTQGEDRELAATPEDDGVTAQALCGPARRIGSPEGHVWDAFNIVVLTPDANTVAFGESDSSDASTALNNRSLWRPDDKSAPDDANALQAPPAPPAEAGLLEVSATAPDGMKDLKPMTAKLVGPDTDLTLTGLATVPVVKSEEGKTLRAADGETFTVLRIKTGEGAEYPGKAGWGRGADTKAQTFLGVANERKPLELTQSGEGGESYVITSTPKDTQLSLGLRVAGVDQVMTLPDGKVDSGQAAAFYRNNTSVAITQSIPSQELEQGDFNGSVSATFETAYLTAWDAKSGWAPAGQAWLELPFEGNLAKPGGYSSYRTTLNPSSMTATVDGKAATLVPALLEENRLVWQVPATAKSVKFSLAPKYTGQAEMPEYRDPDTVSIAAKGTTFDVSFN